MTSSTRNAHLAMADERAMEEMAERHNPVNPKQLLSNKREKVMRNVGAGATPSMGLSQFRGGKKMLGRVQKEPSNLLRAEPSEAHQMGHHLSKHLLQLHGKGFWSDFGDGFKQGFTGTLDALRPVTSVIPGFNQTMDVGRSMVGYGGNHCGEGGRRNTEEGYPMSSARLPDGTLADKRSVSDMRKERFEEARREGMRSTGIPQMAEGLNKAVGMIPGVGSTLQKVGDMGFAATIPGYSGKGKTGAYEGQGRKRGGKRAPAGANDGRRKRAEVVKRVMAEKGLKMIEASKYVKEHGLY